MIKLMYSKIEVRPCRTQCCYEVDTSEEIVRQVSIIPKFPAALSDVY
jgi:hypothetical protein